MDIVLSVVLICFFVLLCIALLTFIIQGIGIISLQRTGKIFISPVAACESSVSYSTLFFKKKFVDLIFIYAKFKGKYYFVGEKGIYQATFMKLKEVTLADLNSDEITLIDQMKKDSYSRLLDNRKVIDSYIAQYERCPRASTKGGE